MDRWFCELSSYNGSRSPLQLLTVVVLFILAVTDLLAAIDDPPLAKMDFLLLDGRKPGGSKMGCSSPDAMASFSFKWRFDLEGSIYIKKNIY